MFSQIGMYSISKVIMPFNCFKNKTKEEESDRLLD
jgi:hypothetical protein